MTDILIRKAEKTDIEPIAAVFNYFVLNSFAAYGEKEMPDGFMRKFANGARISYVAETNDRVVGFACVNPYKELENFNHTGVLTYFILPEFTGKGLGTRLLNQLFDDARELGITNMLANISSKNQQSLRFHEKHGFKECGRFKNMAKKFGEMVDIIWVQKELGGTAPF